jgi:hypothetical protein
MLIDFVMMALLSGLMSGAIAIIRLGDAPTVSRATLVWWIAVATLGSLVVAGLTTALLPATWLDAALGTTTPAGEPDPLEARGTVLVHRAGYVLSILALVALSEVVRRRRVIVTILRGPVATDVARWRTSWNDAVRETAMPRGASLGVLGVVIAGGLALRVTEWGAIEADEAITYVWFASRGAADVLSDYTIPNNHVLHSLLIHWSTMLFGDGLVAVRLPALLAGLACIPATSLLGRRLVGERAGLFAAALVAAAPAMAEFSTLARGYTLQTLLFVLGFAIMAHIQRTSTVTGWVLFVLTMTLGFFAVPTMLYPFAITVSWALLTSRRPLGRTARDLALASLAVVCLASLLYAPIILKQGVGALVANDYVDRLPFERWIRASWAGLTGMAGCWRKGIGMPFGVALGTAFVVGLVVRPSTGRDRSPLLLALAVLLGTAPLMLLQGVAPPPRTLHFLFPLLALAVGRGIDLAIGVPAIPKPAQTGLAAAAIVGAMLIWGFDRLTTPKPPPAVAFAAAAVPGMCREGWFGDLESIARWAAPQVDRRRPIIVAARSGMSGMVRFHLKAAGFSPLLLHPAIESLGPIQLTRYAGGLVIVRRAPNANSTADDVARSLRFDPDSLAQFFATPRLVRRFIVSDVWTLDRLPGVTPDVSPFDLMLYPR